MEKNLKSRFDKDRLINHKRRANHEDIFIEMLYKELPPKRNHWLEMTKIAASVMIVVSLGISLYLFTDQDSKSKTNELVLSQISSDLKEVEEYYVTHINKTLTNIDGFHENQSVIDRYLKRFALLKEEHSYLTEEIKKEGPNSMSINALINNLKRQLELLELLTQEINESKNNTYESI